MIFKGTGRSLKVVITEQADMEDVLLGIEEKLASNPAFYAGQRINVEMREGLVPDIESDRIRAVFRRYGVPCTISDKRAAAEKAAAMMTQTALIDEDPPVRRKLARRAEPEQDHPAIYEGDLIPGKSIAYPGTVVIIGDVLPGGSVRAGGDVIITGIAGGTVHAGWPSDKKARIIAGGFAAGSYGIGDRRAELDRATGSPVSMRAMRLTSEGYTIEEGEPGLVSRRGEQG